jgi:hypothetical protein
MAAIENRAENALGTTRRDLFLTAAAGGTAITAALAEGAAAQTSAPISAAPGGMMFDIYLRFPAGKLEEWIKSWTQNVVSLEARGQSLWAAWYGLTGQQDSATHQWAYRDLAHYQAMAKLRSNPRAADAATVPVTPIEEVLFSAVMTPLPYHPRQPPPKAALGDDSVIVTHRIVRPFMRDGQTHARLMAEYLALTASTGAELHGAFETFFGWTPSYMLHVWRYRSMDHYWSTRDTIARTADAVRLQGAMRAIYPTEIVDLHRPMPYSPLR